MFVKIQLKQHYVVICVLCVLAPPAVTFSLLCFFVSVIFLSHSLLFTAEPFTVAHLLHFCDSGVDTSLLRSSPTRVGALPTDSSRLTELTCSYSTQQLQVVFRKSSNRGGHQRENQMTF